MSDKAENVDLNDIDYWEINEAFAGQVLGCLAAWESEEYCKSELGLDKAMGLAETRISIAAFMYGCVGLITAVVMMNYIMIQDWPQDIGGKPSFSYLQNMPAFVPIMFELTVFFAAHLMVITFYLRSRMWPFKEAENPDKRTTDDHFLVEVHAGSDEEKLKELLLDTGAVEVQVPKTA